MRFRLVIDAGGAGSVHMKDLETFTSVHVNPKVRKLRMEIYAIVAPYPVAFPKNKKRLLKMELESSPAERMVPVASQHLAQIVRRIEVWDVRLHDVV